MEMVTHSNWAAPIVALLKKDGGFPISADYKVTVNAAQYVDQYFLPNPSELFAGSRTLTKLDLSHPLPNSSELFALLAGGRTFTKLDISLAY